MKVDDKIHLAIHDLGHSGEGVGLYKGLTVFVEGALPGEEVEVIVTQCKKNYARAKLLTVIIASVNRVQPPCPIFDKCGGCQIMHLSYGKQLDIKQKRVKQALQRIGKIHDVIVPGCISSPQELRYRNKIQLPVRLKEGTPTLGLYASGSHDLIEIDHCLIHCQLGEEIYAKVKLIVKNSQITIYDPLSNTGELRHILIKSAFYAEQVLVILVTNGQASSELKEVAKQIFSSSDLVEGVIQNINTRNDNVILGRTYNVLEGQAYIQEKICGLTFKISPASFFQVNTQQAECLYAQALKFADLKGNETIVDAYCGVGTLSLIFARHAKKVIGVECVEEAIADAQENARNNKIINTTFICAQAEDFIKKSEKMDLLLLNPPRQGCDPTFLEKIGKLQPRSLIYISCDPATLARDLKILYTYNYQIDAIQPFDMFPQTMHVECVLKLTLRA